MESVVRIHTPLRGALGAEWRLAAGTAGTVVLAATAATLGATGDAEQPAMTALLRAAEVASPLAVALYLDWQRAYVRYASVLASVGLIAFLATLAETSDATLYSAGRMAGWALEVALVLAVLTFPTGRLTATADRRIAVAMAAVVTSCFLPLLVLTDELPVPSPYTSCRTDCPTNAFFPSADASAGASVLLAVGSLATFAVMLAVLLRLHGRIEVAGPLRRQLLLPVLAVGMLRAALVGCAIVGRGLDPDGALIATSATLIAWTTVLLPAAILVGIVRSRLFAERALRRLAAPLRNAGDGPALRRALAGAFDDDTLQIAFPAESGWVDDVGAPLDVPAGGRSRCVHDVRDARGTVVAALVCDAELRDRPELLDAGAALAAVALDNQRLTLQVESSAREVHRSRARIAATADRERRRIERDLHDGAQQRLVALRIELGVVEELARTDPGGCAERIRELEDAVDETLDELRALAHGVCPPILAGGGLEPALRSIAARSPVPVRLELQDVGRYPADIESAVYFCVLEALQNVAKHARGARRAVVRVADDAGALTFRVRDDGPGATPGTPGAGIANMEDRMAAVDGELHVTMRPGTGVEVRGRVPLADRAPAAGAHR